jgi:2-polyprenyl-6-methoxyphenol hydroxylase-like FAD-dependent oxidoreductase
MGRSVAIVGAGVGGLSAALGLCRAGWHVSVLEKWPQVVGNGAALGLWPDAQSALDRLGLGDELQRTAVPYAAGEIRTASGRRLTPLPLARIQRTTGRPVVLLSRTSLMRLLLEAVSRHGVTVRTDVRITEPQRLADEHDVVVGADGLRSAVRRAYFGDHAAPRDAGFTAWRGSVETETGWYGETWGAGRFFGITPMEPGRTNWYAAVRHERPRSDPEVALRHLLALYEGWPAPIEDVLSSTRPETLLQHQVFDLAPPLRSYVQGNAVLVGDAAHAMTPSLGQGACQALIDGVVLADALAEEQEVAAGLRSYDRQRRKPTQRLVAGSARASRVGLAERWLGLRSAALRMSAPLAR